MWSSFLCSLALAMPVLGAPVTVRVDPSRETGRFAPELLGNNVEWVGLCDGVMRQDGSFVEPALQAIKTLAPPVLRFPGGALAGAYDWTGGVGDPAHRAMAANYNKEMESMRFGTDEYLDLLVRVGAKGLVTLNDTASPGETLAWVEHIEKKGGGVPYFEFGNESYLNQDPSFMPVADYVARYKAVMGPIRERFAGLKLGAILEACMVRASWVKYLAPEAGTWNEAVVRGVGALADFYSVHLYAPMEFVDDETTTMATAIAGAAVFERNLADVRALLDRYNPKASIWVTEYNVLTDKPIMNWRCGTAPAQVVFLADLLMVMTRARVAGATYWSLIGNDNFGTIKNAEEPEPRGAGLLFAMLAPLAGARALETTTQGPTLDYKEGGVTPGGFHIHLVGAQAFEKAGQNFLVLTNRDLVGSRRVVVQHANSAPWPSSSGTALVGPMNFIPGLEQGGRLRRLDHLESAEVVLLPGTVMLLRLQ